MRPPKLIQPYVVSFAAQIVGAGAALRYLPCAPLQGALQNERFAVVDAQVRQHGGRAQYGWAIWERPGVYIEAEFHAVWCNSAGQWIDIAPRAMQGPPILFLPDPCRTYQGRQVNNVRKVLTRDEDVEQLFAVLDRMFMLANEAELN
ncbi:hypothetical protein [Chitinolyticbacter meiyuanensis]|uniref:hypothetical protein n=1 Tax=Chitinolyticbacter meiyuanensis TaxID=682798 RepID=UPI0011E5CE1C|nr:hypothetical protein [Chitinolyticbacter meiyuanensis]